MEWERRSGTRLNNRSPKTHMSFTFNSGLLFFCCSGGEKGEQMKDLTQLRSVSDTHVREGDTNTHVVDKGEKRVILTSKAAEKLASSDHVYDFRRHNILSR